MLSWFIGSAVAIRRGWPEFHSNGGRNRFLIRNVELEEAFQ